MCALITLTYKSEASKIGEVLIFLNTFFRFENFSISIIQQMRVFSFQKSKSLKINEKWPFRGLLVSKEFKKPLLKHANETGHLATISFNFQRPINLALKRFVFEN